MIITILETILAIQRIDYFCNFLNSTKNRVFKREYNMYSLTSKNMSDYLPLKLSEYLVYYQDLLQF